MNAIHMQARAPVGFSSADFTFVNGKIADLAMVYAHIEQIGTGRRSCFDFVIMLRIYFWIPNRDINMAGTLTMAALSLMIAIIGIGIAYWKKCGLVEGISASSALFAVVGFVVVISHLN